MLREGGKRLHHHARLLVEKNALVEKFGETQLRVGFGVGRRHTAPRLVRIPALHVHYFLFRFAATALGTQLAVVLGRRA